MIGLRIAEKIIASLELEHVSIRQDLCSRLRDSEAKCQRCAELCPLQAVRFDPAAQSSSARVSVESFCNGCGVCVSACPNGVFQLKRGSDEQICCQLEAEKNKVVSFSCSRSSSDGEAGREIKVPCLGRLTEVILLAAAANGAEEIILKGDDCRACRLRRGHDHLDDVLSLARKLFRLVRANSCTVRTVAAASSNPTDVPPKTRTRDSTEGHFTTDVEGLSRREFLTAFRRKPLLPRRSSTRERPTREESEKDAPHPRQKKVDISGGFDRMSAATNWKRSYLIGVLGRFEGKPTDPTTIPSKPPASAGGFPFADKDVTEDCVLCVACSKICPVSALKRKTEGDSISLTFDPALCTNCGLCEAVCPVRAFRPSDSYDLSLLLAPPKGGGRRTLMKLAVRRCQICRRAFTGNEEVCPPCRKRSQLGEFLGAQWGNLPKYSGKGTSA